MKPMNTYLDAAVLMPGYSREETIHALKTCVALKTRTACVRPCDIELAKEITKGGETGVCVVLGFPHGCQLSESKADEARRYIEAGVDEVDMVVNYGWANSGLWDLVLADIRAVSAVTNPAGIPLKVIFETAQIDLSTIGKLTELCIEGGADFVKTSTGFNGEGATDEGVQEMMEIADGRIKVKPSGGIRDRARAEELVKMGADRLGVNWASCEAICLDIQPNETNETY